MMLLKKVVEDIRMDKAILCYSIPRLQKARISSATTRLTTKLSLGVDIFSCVKVLCIIKTT